MKMRCTKTVALLMVLVDPMFFSLAMADPKPRATGESPKIAEAVFQLSEQAKKEGLVDIKNHFWDVRELPKPLPIEPVLGTEILPDRVETK